MSSPKSHHMAAEHDSHQISEPNSIEKKPPSIQPSLDVFGGGFQQLKRDPVRRRYERMQTPLEQRSSSTIEGHHDRISRGFGEASNPSTSEQDHVKLLDATKAFGDNAGTHSREDDATYTHINSLLGATKTQKELLKCSQGGYPALWYKFKRFESLALLNIYHYQHGLVVLESQIHRPERYPWESGEMSDKQVRRMRRLLKEYYESINLFKDISLMKRPSVADRRAAAQTLGEVFHEDHYTLAPDAFGMLTLDPASLAVESDSIRVFLARAASRYESSSNGGIQRGRTEALWHASNTHQMEAGRSGNSGPQSSSWVRRFWRPRARDSDEDHSSEPNDLSKFDEKSFELRAPTADKVLFASRPYAIPITTGVDTIARLLIALLAGLFLLTPMYALSYIGEMKYRLMTTTLFVVVFAVVASLSSRATNQELMAAVAAYAAVLVVFIGQTIQTNQITGSAN